MVGTLPPYPYLSQIGNLSGQSTLQLSNLSSVNAQYRRNSPNYRAYSRNSTPLTTAQKQLHDYQNALSNLANPFSFAGSSYQAIENRTATSVAGANATDLLSRLQTQGYSSSSFSGSGSRYVLSDIIVMQNDNAKLSQSLNNSPAQATQYRLHYYQDSNQEIILLQNTSNRQFSKAGSKAPESNVSYLQRADGLFGNTAPANYNSGNSGINFGYSNNQDMLIIRKSQGQHYQATNISNTPSSQNNTGLSARSFLQQRLEKLQKINKIQNFVDNATAATSNIVITTPRSQLDFDKIRDSSENLINFTPGLRQGFGFQNNAQNALASGQIISDHIRNKLISSSQQMPNSVARAYSRAGINPADYTNFAALQKSRQNSALLPTVLQNDKTSSRYQYLQTDGVLQFSTFNTSLSNSDEFYNEDNSFISGTMRLVDSPIRNSGSITPASQLNGNDMARGYSMATNIAGGLLNSLSSLINIDVTRTMLNQKLGLGSTSQVSGGYSALLQGNIDVSSTLIQGLSGATTQNSVGLYTIDVAGMGERFISNIDINWQPNAGTA